MSTSEDNSPLKITWYERAGDWVKKNQGDIALIAGFVLVALVSYGVGYLTAPGAPKNPLIIENPQANISEAVAGENAFQTASQQGSEKGLIVASKNSKIYHWPWCAPAKKIKPENEIWFASEAEAQASGRTRCGDFEKLAPAGY